MTYFCPNCKSSDLDYYEYNEEIQSLLYHCLECSYNFWSWQESYICPNYGSYDLDYYDDNYIMDIIIYHTNYDNE